MAKAKYFSKSSYTKGLQCPKILWMDVHMKDKFDKSTRLYSLMTTKPEEVEQRMRRERQNEMEMGA